MRTTNSRLRGRSELTAKGRLFQDGDVVDSIPPVDHAGGAGELVRIVDSLIPRRQRRSLALQAPLAKYTVFAFPNRYRAAEPRQRLIQVVGSQRARLGSATGF